MKLVRLLAIFIVFSLAAMACQMFSFGPTPTETPATGAVEGGFPQPTPDSAAYPQSENPPADIPYPEPAVQIPAPQTGLVYPELQDNAQIDWATAEAIVVSGQVQQVIQTHDLKVFLTLKDGRTLETIEPAIDDIIKLIQSCGEACKEIRVATE